MLALRGEPSVLIGQYVIRIININIIQYTGRYVGGLRIQLRLSTSFFINPY